MDQRDSKIRQPARGGFRYVHRFTDRHGYERYYFRRKGCPRVTLTGKPGSREFLRAYEAAMQVAPSVTPRRPRPAQQIRREENLMEQLINGDAPKVGVYLLFKDGELVYIGSSYDMPGRVRDHKRNGRLFDEAYFIGTKLTERIAVEKALIRALHPEQNRAHRWVDGEPRNTAGWRATWRERFGSDA